MRSAVADGGRRGGPRVACRQRGKALCTRTSDAADYMHDVHLEGLVKWEGNTL